MRGRQISFLPDLQTAHGGSIGAGRRKVARPLDPKRPLHLVMKSSRARGTWSMLHPQSARGVERLVRRVARKRKIRLYRFANVGNHLHLLAQPKSRGMTG